MRAAQAGVRGYFNDEIAKVDENGNGAFGGWSNWLNTQSEAPKSAYVILTRKCNSRCDHCYIEAGPDRKETMPLELRRKVIEQVAESGISHIKFSGGEPTVLDDLFDTLRYAKDTYEKAGYKDFAIELQTNAYFLKGLEENKIEEELGKLKDAGVNALDIASADGYHSISADELVKIGRVAKKVFGERAVEVRGGTNPVIPIGRAKTSVPRSKWAVGENAEYCTKNFNMYYRINIDEDGNVFSCCWQAISIGNVNDAPLKEMIEDAKQPGSLPRKLAEKNGFSKLDPEKDLNISEREFEELTETGGECGGCKEYSERYLEK